MRRKLTWFLLVISMCSLLFCRCKPDKQNSESSQTGFHTEDTSNTTTDSLRNQQVYYRFPSAKEMLLYIQTNQLTYRSDLTNTIENLDHYHSSRSKALNLGVYLTDLSYNVLFNKTQDTDEYFNAIFNLTADLHIKAPHEEELLQKISDNMHNADSLVKIADTYHSRIIDYLMETGKEKTLAIISIGSYIEGLYIALNLITDYEQQELTVEKIAAQKYAFENLAHFAQTFPDDINTQYSLEFLQKINQHFEEFPVETMETTVKRDSDTTLIFEGGETFHISKEKFKALRQEVNTIRNQITNGQKQSVQ